MSDIERIDFFSQMEITCSEEAPLWEVPRGSTDLVGYESVVHGPWFPDDCARVLTRWFDLGLVGLYRPDSDTLIDVERADAYDLLRAPDRWTLDNSPSLYVTEVGSSVPPREWIELASTV
jgi:hypothetical protein